MADYYPLIARAVAGLEKNTGDARRALYERARAALLAQLRSVEPALSENEVTRERLALEESIRKVEGEASRKALVETSGGRGAARVRTPEFPRWEKPAEPAGPPSPPEDAEDPPRLRAVGGGGGGGGRADGSAARQTTARALRSARPSSLAAAAEATALRGQPHLVETANEEPAASDDRAHPSASPQARSDSDHAHSSQLDTGLNDFRNVVSETDELGEAPARAVKSAREVYATVSPRPAKDHADDLPAGTPRLKRPAAPQHEHPVPPMLQSSEIAHDLDRRGMPEPPPQRFDSRRTSLRRSPWQWAKAAVILLLLGGLGSVAAWQWTNIQWLYSNRTALVKPTVPEQKTAAHVAPPKTPAKIPDRLTPSAAPQSTPEKTASAPAAPVGVPGAAVAQKVVLYEEDPANAQGKRYVGSAIWRTEKVSPGPGQPPEIAIRADVEIPERRMAMTWSLRRNTDKSLPATHTVEIVFKLPPDFPTGGISNVPGILMKQAEQARGVPLAGLAVKVTNQFFLIGLSALEADKERNIEMLKDRDWFDIPVVYGNNRRAILAVEKGAPGERVFKQAFAAWKE